MTDTQDLEFVIKYTDDATHALSTLSEWGKKVDLLARAGADLTKVEEILRGFKIFRIATTGSVILGVFAGGLQIVGHLLGMKSIEEQILDAAKDISSQIESLSKQLDDMYEKLVMQMDLHSAREQIGDAVTLIDALKADVDAYVQRLKEGKSTNDIESRFPRQDPRPQIHAAVLKICGAATADPGGSQYNILTPVYDLSYGMLEAVVEQGNYLLQYALMGLYLDGFFSAYKYGKSPGPGGVEAALAEAQDTAERLYGGIIDALADAVEKCARRCKDEVEANLAIMVDKEFNTKLAIDDHDQYASLADVIVERTARQWTWLAWLVVVNGEASGYDDHAVAGPNYWTYWHHTFGTKKKKLQLTVAWADKGATTVIDDSLRALTKDYVHRMLKTNPFGTKKIDDDDMKKVVEDFLHDPHRPRTGTLRVCWHDLNMACSGSVAQRFFVYKPTAEYARNAYGQPLKQAYYGAVLFV